jgi:hypothetical protein
MTSGAGEPPAVRSFPDPDEHQLADLKESTQRMLDAADRARAVVERIQREGESAEPS